MMSYLKYLQSLPQKSPSYKCLDSAAKKEFRGASPLLFLLETVSRVVFDLATRKNKSNFIAILRIIIFEC